MICSQIRLKNQELAHGSSQRATIRTFKFVSLELRITMAAQGSTSQKNSEAEARISFEAEENGAAAAHAEIPVETLPGAPPGFDMANVMKQSEELKAELRK